jgi:protein-L-isoaspartate(D-aspartate) O-methyltransferase
MVERQLVKRGIHDARVLHAMGTVPRHEFVPEAYRRLSYADEPVPIGRGQTISQPYIVAAMAEALDLGGSERVLDVGAGSGYAAAVLAELSAPVYSIEREAALLDFARENLARTGYADRVTVIEGDGTLGYSPEAPYQAIAVAAGAPGVPQPLLDQLDPAGGRLVIPVGSAHDQELRLIRKSEGRLESEVVTYCRFVPLQGEQGWPS